MDPNQAN
jgi:polo-like kinase 1